MDSPQAPAGAPARPVVLGSGVATALAIVATHGRAQAIIATVAALVVTGWCASPREGVGWGEHTRGVRRMRKVVAVVSLSVFLAARNTDVRWIGLVLIAVAFAVAFVTDARAE